MDHKDKRKKVVSGDDLESYKEKMKRSLLGSNNAEVEPVLNEVAEVKNSSPTMRECDICGRVFNGGKALGGHRRSHFQKNQKKVIKVRFSSKNNNSANCTDYNNDDDDDGKKKHVCCICEKVFPTKNALFGHMRSHPERSWRGVSPPTLSHKPSSSSSYNSYDNSSSLNSDSMEKNHEGNGDENGDDDCVCDGGGNDKVIAPPDEHKQADLSKFTFFPSWVKKDKRGRKCIGGIEAAETLAFLRNYSKYYCVENVYKVAPKKDDDEVLLPKSDPPLIKHGKRKIGESSRGNNNEVGKKLKFCFKGTLPECGEKLNRGNNGTLSESGVERMNMDDDNDVDEDVDDVMNSEETLSRVRDDTGQGKVKKVDMKGNSGKKLVLKSKGKEPEYESGNQEKVGGYKCGACGKVFSTFQGLGGHRSIHKEKNIVIMDESNHANDHADAIAVAEENNSSTSSNMDKVDEALLNEGIGEAGDESPDAKTLAFDLNEVPNNVMED